MEEKEILQYGVIVDYTPNKSPIFLHQSFAEFFLAKSCFIKIEQNKNDAELKRILREKGHFLIRKFLNDLLTSHPHHEQQIKPTENEDFQREIENCCRENLISLLRYFSQEIKENVKKENKFLILAAKHGNADVAKFLVEKGIDVNQEIKSEHKQEDEVDDRLGTTALMWASNKGDQEIVHILLTADRINVNQQDIYGRTP